MKKQSVRKMKNSLKNIHSFNEAAEWDESNLDYVKPTKAKAKKTKKKSDSEL